MGQAPDPVRQLLGKAIVKTMGAELLGTLTGKGKAFVQILEAESTECRFRPVLWILLPLLLLAGATLFFRFTNVDLALETAIYRAGNGTWEMGQHPFWSGLYEFGNIPSILVIVGSLVGLIAATRNDGVRRWRRVFLYIILLHIIAPGIITNALLKEYWDRPRPREVIEMGGHREFEKILTLGSHIEGKSFPCGHATMGFVFFGGFFLLRRSRRWLAEAMLYFALAFGGLIGAARMVQGGHFASDVVWACAICWFCALGLYYALRLDRGLVTPRGVVKRMSPWLRIGIFVTGGLVIVGIILGTPYREVRNYYPIQEFSKGKPLHLLLQFKAGEITLKPGEDFRVTGEAYGHGKPTSKLGVSFAEYDRGGYSQVVYSERIGGWFSELSQQLEVSVPWKLTKGVVIGTGKAEIWISPDRASLGKVIQLADGEGKVLVFANELDYLVLDSPAALASIDQGELAERFVIVKGDAFSGSVEVKNAPLTE